MSWLSSVGTCPEARCLYETALVREEVDLCLPVYALRIDGQKSTNHHRGARSGAEVNVGCPEQRVGGVHLAERLNRVVGGFGGPAGI